MKILTRPLTSPDGAALVQLACGSMTADLTPEQAEDIAVSLMRAATTSRYEAGLATAMQRHGSPKKEIELVTTGVRQAVEERRVTRN